MKRVRYLVGALGATPAFGLMTPAANAMAAGPDVPCGSAATEAVIQSARHSFYAAIFYHNTVSACIRSDIGTLLHHQTGLAMRTRVYTIAGYKVFSAYAPERPGSITSDFSQPVHRYGWELCAALVEATHHSVVKYGPVCKNGL
jgi:hypothetical protein